MILLTLIKKEIKEFFRNKSDVIVMLIFPVILIFVMGKSLDDLMSVEKNIFNINKTDLSYGRGYVYSLQYHLVWCTKYRKKVLTVNLSSIFLI